MEKQRMVFETWKVDNEDTYKDLLNNVKKMVAKKYPTCPVLLKNDIYCESLMRIKLRKDGIIY